MYKIIATISWFIRQFYIDNPFEALGEGVNVNINGNDILLSPEILNWLFGGILVAVTYSVVGIYYKARSCPALGSILYLFFYCVHTFLIYLMSLLKFNVYGVWFIILIYCMCHIIINSIINRYKIYVAG